MVSRHIRLTRNLMLNHLLLIILDSARYDAVARAKTPNMDRIGKLEKRWSYSSWTFPSHQVFLMGLMPHQNRSHIYASEIYRSEYASWCERTGIETVDFKSFLPQLSLPLFLSHHGYRNEAFVSMPVLNPATNLNQYFQSYRLMAVHNDFGKIIEAVEVDATQPTFYMLNLGETHYPYTIRGNIEDTGLPRIHGVHGALRHFQSEKSDADNWFTETAFAKMKMAQIAAVEEIDRLLPDLLDKFPSNQTHVMITADHGELFGEEGYFGHGPIMHPKVFEVPFVEGKYV